MAQLLAADPDAEAAILALLLFSPNAVEALPSTLRSADFFTPRYQRLMDAIQTCIATHGVVDIASMRLPGDLEEEVNYLLKMPTPSLGLMGRYVEAVREAAASRSLVHLLSDTTEAINQMDASPRQIIEQMVGTAEGLYLDGDDSVDGFHQYEEWAESAVTSRPKRWVIPGIIRESTRMMIVGFEGQGKSTLLRQFAICAAAGVHPFTGKDVPQQRVLLVDLENDPATGFNPEDGTVDLASPLGLLRALKNRQPHWNTSNYSVWSRPDGIDLRSTLDMDRFERVLQQAKPDLVCMGPIYKAYRKREREDDETLTAGLQQAFDRLRVKYGCAWVLEHHAPLGDSYKRAVRPYGSSFWLRWPDIGIAMIPELDADDQPTGVFKLGRFRGDRYRIDTPRAIKHGVTTPWVAAK